MTVLSTVPFNDAATSATPVMVRLDRTIVLPMLALTGGYADGPVEPDHDGFTQRSHSSGHGSSRSPADVLERMRLDPGMT